MQNVPHDCSPPSVSKKIGEESEKSSTPQSNPIETGAVLQDDSGHKFISDSSESEEDDVSEVESFMIEQDADERIDSKFLLSGACADAVDPETQERLEALLQAAGIGRLGSADGKHLADPEVLRRLTSSVSCALDEAAAALTRMRTDHPRPESRSLVEACSDGDVITVRKLLTEGKSVNETNEEGESLLSLACSAGYLELAQVLLAMKADVEDRGVKGDCTPLMEAASAGHVDIVTLLLNHSAKVNAQSASGNTPLMYACAGGHEQCVKLLLECAANVEDHNENGHTPLMEAASAGHVGVARILLNYGAGINTHSNEFKESALTLACYKGHLDMVRFLLEAGADQEHKTDEMHTALMEASMDGHVEVARLLLDSGAQVNMPTDSFESPLTLAACGGHTELAMLLIERGANIEEVNDEGYTPLMEAAREGHEDMVALLLSQGANINAQTEETQETALTLACCGGFLEVADFLLKAGADLEAGASTPLMEAAQEGHLDLVRYLLEYHHANVNAQTQTGDTALTYACENGHTDVASLLLLYGAHLEHESEGGRTPLMKACRAGHTYTVQYLISKNADVNKMTSSNDHTPLSLASSGGHLAVVELLLGNRADPFHRLKDNSTMLIEAAKGGHTNVVHLLLDYPHSVMMQPSADGDARKQQVGVGQVGPGEMPAVAAPEPEPEEPSTPAPPAPLAHVQRSLLRKLRPAASSDPVLNPPEAHQVRPPPAGEASSTECEVEDKTDSPPSVEPSTPVAFSVNHPFQVSQNTAISDRPKAKPFSKKDGKSLRKMLSQPVDCSDLSGAVVPGGLLAATASCVSQPPLVDAIGHIIPTEPVSIPLSLTDRGNVYSMQPVDGVQMLQKQQQMWMLQHPGHPTLPVHPAHSGLHDESTAKAKDAADQIDTLVMDFAQKLEAFSIDEVSNEQERLVLRARQQLSPEEVAAAEEEAYNLLSQQQQDLTYISVPGVVNQIQRNEEGLQVEYQYAQQLGVTDVADAGAVVDVTGLQMAGSPLQLSATGQPITVTRTNQGNIEIFEPGQFRQGLKMCSTAQEKVDFSYAAGFKQGLAWSKTKSTPGPIAVPGLTLPQRLIGATGFSPQLLLPTSPLSSGAFCCPAAPVEPPVRIQQSTQPPTQVQVATQTTTDKKQSSYYPPPLKGKKVRFQGPNSRNAVYAQTSSEQGLAQCSGAYPTPCAGAAAPTPPLQLSACMDVDSETDSNHDTALTLACAGGHEELVELLLSRGADIEHRDKKGFTPLILAATAGHEKVVEILLNHGADIEAQSERTKDTPLSLACSGGRYEVVELLLNKMANKEHRNVSDYTPLSLAASGGYVNIIKLLLNHGAEINSRTGSKLGISPLMLASMNGHVAAVKLLLDMGSDINAQIETNRNTALTLACFQGRHEVVSLLLDRKANVEHRAKTGLTPLMEAASGGYVEVGRVLIDKGADVNASPVPSSRDTALTIAADKGHGRFVELLLSRSALVEVKNKKGNSPLWLAANGGHLGVIELLYNLEADIDSQDNRKVSCLMAAFRKGHVKVVKWMVNHVTQFPSDQEMTRFIATISDKELLDKCHECVKIIRAAKDLQSAKANKNASILLEELDMEKNREESKKAAAARRRERKKKKKLEKKEERRKLYEENSKPDSDEDEEEEDEGDTEAHQAAEASKAERLGSASPVPDKEEGDSGIDANSQGSCSSNDVKAKEPTISKRKDKKKKKTADKLSDTSPPKLPEGKEKTKDRRCGDSEDKTRLEMISIRSAPLPEVTIARHPAEREDFEATGNETYIPASRGRKSNSNTHQNHHEPESSTSVKTILTTSPKGPGKREEGWKEVVRSFPYRSKKVSVPLNAISRVIGRAGSNINAIRAATGAHIEVDKQSKGQGERTITIKGSADATKQAHNLIAVLIKDPEVDIVQMLPKAGKPGLITAVAVNKTKVAACAKAAGPVIIAATSSKQSAVPPSVAKVSQVKSNQLGLGVNQSKATTGRILTTGDGKRSSTGATKTTMSYTSVIMAPGRVSKPLPATVVPTLAPMPMMGPISPLVKPRAAVGPVTPPAPSAPPSPQVSPPQPLPPMPPSPKHHRPPPTSSAPPTMQQPHNPMAAKLSVQTNPPNQHMHHMPHSQTNQELLTHNLLHEYSLFNNGFSKSNMWGREQEKQNFASVAATGAPGAKFLDEVPTQVDVTKAPGYRAHGGPGCSPVKPFSSYPSDPTTSPRGAEQATHSQMALLAPMQMEVGPNAAAAVAPIGPPMYGPRTAYLPTDQAPMYSTGDLQYQLPSPPPAIQMSRLNPRAPDFSFSKPGRAAQGPVANTWPYAHAPTHAQDLVFPQQPTVSDLLSFENTLPLTNSPNMSPHSPIQSGLAQGEMKTEDRKIPRPIGTERHNFKIGGHNGYEHLDPSWMANYRPAANQQYRHLHDDLTLLDHSYQGGLNEVQYHNGTALAQQLMLAQQQQQQQQVPMPMPPITTLDPSKLENWEMDKHTAYSEGWTSTKWTH